MIITEVVDIGSSAIQLPSSSHTVEYIGNQFFKFSDGGNINGYDTIYIPLRKAFSSLKEGKVVVEKTAEQYKEDYKIRMDILKDYFEQLGFDDPSYQATLEFDETANASEVIGYYLSHFEGVQAIREWLNNIAHIEQERLTKQDQQVTEVLLKLFGFSNKDQVALCHKQR